MPRRIGYLAVLLLMLSAAGCNQTENADPGTDSQDTPVADEAEVAGGPTIVARAGPQMTAEYTANRLSVVDVAEIEGVVVPGGAELVEFTEATQDSDAHAVFSMSDGDAAEMRDWFETQMLELGWGEPQLTDGSLVFRHLEQFSERYARQGLRRSATIHFSESDEGLEINLIVEEPAQAE